MAHTKAAGSSKLGRESKSKRLGVKLFGDELAKPGMIIIRQRGTKFVAGDNTKVGVDHTIYATAAGKVSFRKLSKTSFNGKKKEVTRVSVS